MLSTCNRIEIYARCTHFHAAVGDVLDFLAAHSGAARRLRRPPLHVLRRSRGRAPLLGRRRPRLDDRRRERDPRPGPRRVADRGAAKARRASCSPACSATRSSRQAGAHRDRIGRHPVSIPSAAVAVAPSTSCLDGGRAVLVVGAGQMGAGPRVARCVARGVGDVVVANRTFARARRRSPSSVGGRADPARRARRHARRRRRAAHRPPPRPRCSSSARRSRWSWRAATARRCSSSTSPCPATSTPACGEIHGVTLLDLDDLKDYARARSHERRARDRQGPRDPRGRDRAVPDRPRRARGRAARHVAARARRGVRAGELERFRAKLDELDPDDARRGRGAHAGHRQQAAARADRAGEGRGRHRARRALRRRARGAVRPAATARGRPDPDDPRPRSPRAAARSPAGRPSASSRCSARPAELVLVSTHRRPRPARRRSTRSAAPACS